MLFTIDVDLKQASELPVASLASLSLMERYDLQEWVIQNPRILGEELLVISSEFNRFDRTSERLDVLALDRNGKLVVVELKRSAVGTAAELQALRYAAYCSTMSLQDVTELLAEHLARRGSADTDSAGAEERIRKFVNRPDFTELDDQPRLILAAEEFSPEITATVLWLRSYNVDITCVRLRPYTAGSQLLLDASILIPLPETREYQIRRERKTAEQAVRTSTDSPTAEQYLATVAAEPKPLLERIRTWLLAHEIVREIPFKTLLSYRRAVDNDWITWIQATRYEARVAISPEIEVDPALLVRTSSSGWQIVRARNEPEVQDVLVLLDATLRTLKEAKPI